MRKKIIMILAVLGFAGWLAATQTVTATAANSNTEQTAETQPTTLYLHGHMAGPRAMRFLMQYAHDDVGAYHALTAVVSASGHVTFEGHWNPNAQKPMVQVIFTDNRNLNFHKSREWLHNVLAELQDRYGVRRFNIVAHSLGNTATLFYMLKYGKDKDLPQMDKWVSIAGNFDGVPGMHHMMQGNRILRDGRPKQQAPLYRRAILMRKEFPVDQVQMLNIYGDLDNGTHSDGVIWNASSRSLGYLLGRQAKSYQTLRIDGWWAEHHRIKNDPKVAQAVDNFLWRQ